jgi:DNA-binding transcriptional regulator YhcF (GntR family)
MNGWIKVHRALSGHHVASDPHSLSVWLHMLMMANHRETKRQINGRVLVVQPGQLITSRKSLAEKTGVNESKVERVLKMLQSEQLIEQHGTAKFRVISITNWAKYQVDEQVDEQLVNNRRTAGEQQTNTPEEVSSDTKNENNGKKTATQGKPRVNWLNRLIDLGVDENHAKDWLAVRKAKKATMTETALDGVTREASLAGITLGEAVKISAENSWQGFKASWMTKTQGSGGFKPFNKQAATEENNNRVVQEILEREAKRMAGGEPDKTLDLGEPITIEGEFIHAFG